MSYGGAERYLIDLAALIRDWGYEPRVFQPGRFAWRRRYRDVPIESIPIGDSRERTPAARS